MLNIIEAVSSAAVPAAWESTAIAACCLPAKEAVLEMGAGHLFNVVFIQQYVLYAHQLSCQIFRSLSIN